MKLKHELPTELDTFFSVDTNIDLYIDLYQEELVTDEEYKFITNYFEELYMKQEERELSEWQEIQETNESLRYD